MREEFDASALSKAIDCKFTFLNQMYHLEVFHDGEGDVTGMALRAPNGLKSNVAAESEAFTAKLQHGTSLLSAIEEEKLKHSGSFYMGAVDGRTKLAFSAMHFAVQILQEKYFPETLVIPANAVAAKAGLRVFNGDRA